MENDDFTGDSQAARRWLVEQAAILDDIIRGAGFEIITNALARLIASQADGLICAICLVDSNRSIVNQAFGAGLPEEYRKALVGSAADDPVSGACRLAMAEQQTITAAQIPDRFPWRSIFRSQSIQYCQTTPILGSDARVAGMVVVFGQKATDRVHGVSFLSETAARLAAIAIQRRRGDAALRETEERLHVAIKGADLGTWDLNAATGEFSCSERWKEMFGFAPGERVDYEDFLAAIHLDDRCDADHAIRNSLDREDTFDIEFRCVRPGRPVRWIASIGCGFRNGHGDPIFIRGIVIDITQRREAEAAAAESTERFRFLAESLPEKLFTATPDGETDYLNQQWAIYTGHPLDEVIRLGWREFVHPDDLDEKTSRWKYAIRTGTPFEFEHRFRRADGAYRWHLSRAHPMRRADGAIIMWVGSNTDVDDLKRAHFDLRESESRSRLAMEAAGLGFWDWTIGGAAKWSPEHNRMLGIDTEIRDGTYEQFLQRVHPDDRATLESALDRARNQRLDFETEFRALGTGGDIRWLIAHGRAYYDEQTGRPVRMIGVMRDITERKKFEEQLRRNQEELRAALAAAELSREQAEAASRAKDQFLAVLSHELRTPLTPVLMAVSAIGAEKGLAPHVRSALEMIQRNIKIEARLIEDLLDLTRLSRNKIQLQIEPMDLHLAVRRALEICAADIEAKKHRLRLNLAAEKHRVGGDLARLQQVFWNLIKNAVKFTPQGGQITIRSFNADGRICIEVSDSGLGISPDVMPRIFNPFEQGDRNNVRQLGGLGLGLAISKATMDAHRGRLHARSAGKNLGATFSVELATIDA